MHFVRLLVLLLLATNQGAIANTAQCSCALGYRNGATSSDTSLCMGPSESGKHPCYPAPCNADWKPCARGKDVLVTTFDSTRAPSHSWVFQADPVMGGQSSGAMKTINNVGILYGVVRDIPRLNAPGFIKIQTPDSTNFPDARSCTHFKLEIKTAGTNTNYGGWRFGVGSSQPSNGKGQRHAYGHKGDFAAPSNQEFLNITMPFNEFSNYWNPSTGDAIVTCKEDVQYCMKNDTLNGLGNTISVWAEGKNGDVELHIRNIYVGGCDQNVVEATGGSAGSSIMDSGSNNSRINVVNTLLMMVVLCLMYR